MQGTGSQFVTVVVSLVVGHSARDDDDQAMARVRVPTGRAARLPKVALDVEVRGASGLLPRVPDLAVVVVHFCVGQDEMIKHLELLQSALGDGGTDEPVGRSGPGDFGMTQDHALQNKQR